MKAASPDFTFTTDVIVGFPGETESDFEETLLMIKEVEFAKVHMFPYSKRDRTRAADKRVTIRAAGDLLLSFLSITRRQFLQ